MFIQPLAGLSLLISVSVNPGVIVPDAGSSLVHLTAQQKHAIFHPLVQRANECVAYAVGADPRLGKRRITDLIVDSFGRCAEPVRTLIDTHDRMYGLGSGQQFFMGPYLDALPEAVINLVGQPPR
jgi:hypothetical protein